MKTPSQQNIVQNLFLLHLFRLKQKRRRHALSKGACLSQIIPATELLAVNKQHSVLNKAIDLQKRSTVFTILGQAMRQRHEAVICSSPFPATDTPLLPFASQARANAAAGSHYPEEGRGAAGPFREGRSLCLRVRGKSCVHLQDAEGLSLRSLSTVPGSTDKQVLALPNVFDQRAYSFQPWHSTATATTWSKFFWFSLCGQGGNAAPWGVITSRNI